MLYQDITYARINNYGGRIKEALLYTLINAIRQQISTNTIALLEYVLDKKKSTREK
jgi:hypothetical protein